MLEDVHSFLTRQLSLKVPSNSGSGASAGGSGGANGSFPTTNTKASSPNHTASTSLSVAANNALQYRSFRQHHRSTQRQTSEGPARPPLVSSSMSHSENVATMPKIAVVEDLVDDIASGVVGVCRTIREKSAERLGEAVTAAHRRAASVRSNPVAAISQTQQQTKLAISKVVNRVASFRSAILSHSSSKSVLARNSNFFDFCALLCFSFFQILGIEFS